MTIVRKSFFLLLMSALLFYAGAASAHGSLREVAPLTFGHIAVTGTPPLRIVVAPDGAVSTPDGGVTMQSPRPSNGLNEQSGYTTVTRHYSTVADTTLSGAGGALDLTDFIFDPPCTMATPCAPSGGELLLKIGATLTTRASTTYGPGPYRGAYDLNLMLSY